MDRDRLATTPSRAASAPAANTIVMTWSPGRSSDRPRTPSTATRKWQSSATPRDDEICLATAVATQNAGRRPKVERAKSHGKLTPAGAFRFVPDRCRSDWRRQTNNFSHAVVVLVRGAATQHTLDKEMLQDALAATSAKPRASRSNTTLIRRLVLSSRCVTSQMGNCSEGRLGSTFSMPGSASHRTSGCIEMP